MESRSVRRRIAVDLRALGLRIPPEEALRMLTALGFRVVDVDVIAAARRCVGRSGYRRGALPREAPRVVDCSSFVKWCYGLRGVWVPRYTIQQLRCGVPIERDGIQEGDLVYTNGRHDYYEDDPAHGIGHVGIASSARTIIHAANRLAGVVEVPLEEFLRVRAFRGARRMIPEPERLTTLRIPSHRSVECADDLRWIILQVLPDAREEPAH